MKAMLLLIIFGMLGCSHDEKSSDPVVTPNPPSVDPTPPPLPEITKEKTIVVNFKFNSSKLTKDQKDLLKKEITAKKEGTPLVIVGHTDSQGSKHYNQRLSEKRAKAVSKYLNSLKIENTWTAKGETELLNKDKTKTEHKENRRASIGFSVVVK